MPIQFQSTFVCNAIRLVSAARRGEEGTPNRIAEDLTGLSQTTGINFQHDEISCKEELFLLLEKIKTETADGLRPILHLDMHGNPNGLEIGRSGEQIVWKDLIEKFEDINVNTENNLFVFVTACEGLNLIRPISILRPTPFFGLLAPQDTITVGDVEDGAVPFLKTLLETRNLNEASKVISDKFRFYNSEQHFIISYAKYIQNDCLGKGKRQRKERLLSETLLEGNFKGMQNTTYMRKQIRKGIDAQMKPTQQQMDECANRFLIGKTSPAKISDILRILKEGTV